MNGSPISAPATQNERTQAVEDVEMLKGDLARLQEESRHTQELKNLANQEESAASRLSYERLLADKRVVDTRLDEAEVMNISSPPVDADTAKTMIPTRQKGKLVEKSSNMVASTLAHAQLKSKSEDVATTQ